MSFEYYIYIYILLKTDLFSKGRVTKKKTGKFYTINQVRINEMNSRYIWFVTSYP